MLTMEMISRAIQATGTKDFRVDEIRVGDSATERIPGVIDTRTGLGATLIQRGPAQSNLAVSGINVATGDVLGTALAPTRRALDEIAPATPPTDQYGNPVNGTSFQYFTYDTTHLQIPETTLAPLAPYGKVEPKGSWTPAQTVRYGLAGFVEILALERANNRLDLEMRARLLPSQILTMVLWSQLATLLTTTGNYATNHAATISGGSEWDASGVDATASIDPLKTKIIEAIGGDPYELTLWLSYASLAALRRNAKYQAAFSSFQAPGDTASAELQRVATYFGVGRAIVINPLGVSTRGGSIASLFADSAGLIMSSGTNADWLDPFGGISFMRRFAPSATPLVLDSFEDRDRRVRFFPVEEEWLLKIVNTSAGALLLNTKA